MAYSSTSYVTVPASACLYVCVCVCVCVCERKRWGDRDRKKGGEEGKVGKKGENKKLNYSY